MTLSISRRRSALPIVASLLVALLLPATIAAQPQSKKKKRGAAPAEPANPEAALADEGAIYILVDQKAMLAQIKVRGIALEVLPLKALAFLDYQTAFSNIPDRVVQLPALFTVEEDVNSVYRKYVAPEELITVEEAEKLEAERVAAVKAATEAAKAAGQQAPAPNKGEPPAEPERPTEYRILLNEGWALHVSSEAPDRGFVARLKTAFHDGMARLRSEEVVTPQLLELTLTTDDARRIHRLLHPGLKILVIG